MRFGEKIDVERLIGKADRRLRTYFENHLEFGCNEWYHRQIDQTLDERSMLVEMRDIQKIRETEESK